MLGLVVLGLVILVLFFSGCLVYSTKNDKNCILSKNILFIYKNTLHLL